MMIMKHAPTYIYNYAKRCFMLVFHYIAYLCSLKSLQVNIMHMVFRPYLITMKKAPTNIIIVMVFITVASLCSLFLNSSIKVIILV